MVGDLSFSIFLAFGEVKLVFVRVVGNAADRQMRTMLLNPGTELLVRNMEAESNHAMQYEEGKGDGFVSRSREIELSGQSRDVLVDIVAGKMLERRT